ncbi:MAG: ABC transporter permease, partial [Gemmatimonadetes bacterium]|nr:ABC transporter permease [Gemmatimonadota bacterium]
MPRILSRVAAAVLLVWLVLTLTFVLVHAAPGDAADLLVPPGASSVEAARVRASLGLDQPVLVQYGRWITRAASGDLGESASLARPVGAVLADVVPVSLALGLASLAGTYLVGVAVGFFQARRRGATDTAVTLVTTAVYATPVFWLGLAAIAATTLGAGALGLPPALRLPALDLRARVRDRSLDPVDLPVQLRAAQALGVEIVL